MTTKGRTANKRAAAREKALIEAEKKRKARVKAKASDRKTPINKTLTPAQKKAIEAKTALEAEEKATAQACMKEVLEVCKKHNCRLHAQPITIPRQDGTFVLGAQPLISNLPTDLPAEEVEEEPEE